MTAHEGATERTTDSGIDTADARGRANASEAPRAGRAQRLPSRRQVITAGAAGVGAAGISVAVAACSSGAPASSGGAPSGSSAGSSGAPSSTATGSTGSGTAAQGAPVGAQVQASRVPVGGGYIDDKNEIVVTQPESGDFHAFTAVCTHQGCVVGSVEANVIICPCHASHFDAKTGEVVSGPASRPLAAVPFEFDGAQVSY